MQQLRTVKADLPRGDRCDIAFVGEAPGYEEAHPRTGGRPFIGKAGRLLNRVLREEIKPPIDRRDCLVTNVFTNKPPSNNIQHFFEKKLAAKKNGLKDTSPYPPFDTYGYLKEEFEWEVQRLITEINTYRPNVVIAMGATALWALTSQVKIGTYRGNFLYSTLILGLKVMPTYHPAAILRRYSNIVYLVSDIQKAKDAAHQPSIIRPNKTIHIEPTPTEVFNFLYKPWHLATVDLETAPRGPKLQMTCVGIGDANEAMIIPFYDSRKPEFSYYSREDEYRVMHYLKDFMEDVQIRKLFHNGLYDIQVFKQHGITVQGILEDTMLLHHSLQPEVRRGLDVVASLHLDVPTWKDMVTWKTSETKDDA